ncbi:MULTISPECIES: hypothetical protein [unclassified Pseudomonas]|uniref:hypothetical protein n=1 Tax=unclassified Pseudomonas TaxID=196821 RepID=UPI002AC988C0|nr:MULTISPECIES: hypothetical protein [unclassified Pseudomonas]MEB0046771.1 hypothetical protein [Pseudomonas sp. Dout3]MEB0097621.1 hypothetical protein [Pseudomonas sp. DC1.2]WPX61269.1 hypothetical protein RHM68_11725 [Pseudomonas sp. DC1.2]
MKLTPLILAGLLTFCSASAFAEGGAERMRYYFDNLSLNQQQTQGKTEATVSLDKSKNTQAKVEVPTDQTAQVTQSNS